jgi:integrase/recombinase XerD
MDLQGFRMLNLWPTRNWKEPKKGVDDAMIQPYSGHESRKSLEINSKLSLSDCQEEYEEKIKSFPI